MKYIPCNVCGADNWVVLYPSTLGQNVPQVEAFRCTSPDYGEHPQIVRCHHCHHVYANPTWEDGELLSAYSEVEDETYLAERKGREVTFGNHLRRLERLVGPANGRSLLDVGAYIGVFVDVARQAGWRAVGLEPSTWAAQVARQAGLPVIEGTLAQSAEPLSAPFDVITLWDVVEHLGDPAQEIGRACQLLAPGGYIVLHTMNVASLTAKMMGARWPWYMAMHVHYFSPNSLGQLLRQHGLEVIKSETVGRVLRLGYLGSRLEGFYAPLGRLVSKMIYKSNAATRAIPINFGDLFTIYARKPSSSP